MTNNILTTTTNLIYIPEFNFNTGKYEDKIPYEPYQRNRPIYECRCRSGFFFNKTNEFNQHIKTSTHLHFIQNYENYYKEVDEALDTIKDLRIEIDKLKKKKTKLKNKNKELNKTIESMKK